ncbi:GNAT family N-acetyltransferase [Robbsia sp. Bb-Pol-6]|uniref:GNAT family N-acetyltransferase n=1 Tax=Robbsia betulipollinis TaxID=2981849 RepID=A0ABT3ZJ13_9BURK|nr:GNAT family N-acetyltransferase [Robbsia betulipollinis]MCY0386514.1 GNAT family N-acetyltransferase [Robbsia betulipollinis]
MTESSIDIVSFDGSHAEGVLALILPIQQIEFGVPVTLDAQPDLLDIDRFYRQGKGNFWVALAQGNVVGSIALLDLDNEQAALRKMFVAEAYRGSAHGVGLGLLRTLLQWAQEKGIVETFLGTTEQFLAAHRFYEKNGFERIAKEALPARFPVMTVDTRFYVHRAIE